MQSEPLNYWQRNPLTRYEEQWPPQPLVGHPYAPFSYRRSPMRADEAASATIQIVRADRDFFSALEKTQTDSSEQLRQALMEFYVQPHQKMHHLAWGTSLATKFAEATWQLRGRM